VADVANGIYVNGVPILLDLDGQLRSFLDQWLAQEFAQHAPSMAQADPRSGPVGHLELGPHLPLVNYPPRPQLKLNQLYWPTGATRFGEVTVVMDEASATVLASQQTRTPVRLSVWLNKVEQYWGMYVESIRPINFGPSPNRVMLVRLVDQRYFWQYMGVGASPFGRPIATGPPAPFNPRRAQDVWHSWANVIYALQWSIGQYIYYDAIPASYLYPDPDSLARGFENVAQVMDAVAHSIGMRVVIAGDGTVWMMNATRSYNLMQYINQYAQPVMSGGLEVLKTEVQRVLIACPICQDGHLSERFKWSFFDCSLDAGNNIRIIDDTRKVWQNTPDAGRVVNNIGFPGFSEVIYTSCLVDYRPSKEHDPYDSSNAVNPINYDRLRALAEQIFKDYWAYDQHVQRSDFTLPGLYTISMNGFMDHALYELGRESEPEHNLVSIFEHDDTTPPPVLETTRQRLLTTRVRTMPKRVRCRQQLSQDATVPLVYEPYFRIVSHQEESDDDAVETLYPGSWAYGQWWHAPDESGVYYERTPALIVPIYDPLYQCLALTGETVRCEWSIERSRWEVCRPHGLLRRGKVSAETPVGSLAGVVLHKWYSEFSPQITISARLQWMAGTSPAKADSEATIVYDSDEQEWWIIGLECS
jgi:hypothetical protein